MANFDDWSTEELLDELQERGAIPEDTVPALEDIRTDIRRGHLDDAVLRIDRLLALDGMLTQAFDEHTASVRSAALPRQTDVIEEALNSSKAYRSS